MAVSVEERYIMPAATAVSSSRARIDTNRATPRSSREFVFSMLLLSSDDRVVVVHPGLRSNRKNPICLRGNVCVARRNVGGDLHAVDAGACGDRGAGANS